jgi:hypothetical protein
MYAIVVGFCRDGRPLTGSATRAVRDMQSGMHQEITIKAVKPCSNNRKYVKQDSFATTLLLILPNLTKVIG